MKYRLPSCTSEDSPADKDGGPQGGRLSVTCVLDGLVLIDAQQVECEQDGQKGRFSCPEVLCAETIGSEIVLQFLDPLFDGCPPVVVTPQ